MYSKSLKGTAALQAKLIKQEKQYQLHQLTNKLKSMGVTVFGFDPVRIAAATSKQLDTYIQWAQATIENMNAAR